MEENTKESSCLGEKEEIWDVYDEHRQLVGRTHRRNEPMNPGDYHLVIHVCIFNSKNEMLIQQRQPWKKGWPNMWDVTVGGSAVAGDNSQMAAERETMEELGLSIDLTGVRPNFTTYFPNGFDDYYLIQQDVDLDALSLQQEEVKNVKWASKEEVLRMVESGEMIPHRLMAQLFELVIKIPGALNDSTVTIQYATMEQLDAWMNLIDVVRWNPKTQDFTYFPGLETQELLVDYKDTVTKNIHRHSAICAVNGHRLVGILLFSTEYNMLCCMAVHPEFRRRGIAKAMVEEMLLQLDRTKDIIVDTFCEEDEKGNSARPFYESMGFEPGECMMWTDSNGKQYPVQRFTLKTQIK